MKAFVKMEAVSYLNHQTLGIVTIKKDTDIKGMHSVS